MKFIVLLAVFFLAGCATRAVETEALLKHPPRDLPRRAEVAAVPYVKQAANYCGPATLSMALGWAGRMVTVDELATQTFTPVAHGTFQTDMISASRRQGMLAIPIQGLPALLTEVAAGHPVIVFENLAFNWYPMYHYALVYGYDLDRKDVVMHSGPVEAKHWSLYKFERSWMLGDYWGLVVLPPGQIAMSADDLAHATAAAALEGLGFQKEAHRIYESVVERWPESLSGLIGLANLVYSDGDAEKAAGLLARATASHPDSAAAWHNRAVAEGAAHHLNDARQSARRALDLASPQQKAAFAESLKEFASPVL